jgi:hypothetical protein
MMLLSSVPVSRNAKTPSSAVRDDWPFRTGEARDYAFLADIVR